LPGRPVENPIEELNCFRGAAREQVMNRLKAEQEALKTLQKRVMQLASDPCALTDAFLQKQFELWAI
jgi:hypothetical protein